MDIFRVLQSGMLTIATISLLWLILLALRGRMGRDDPLWVVFVVALVIRIPLAIAVYHTLPHNWLDVDWERYESVGEEIAYAGAPDIVLSHGFALRAHALANAAVFWLAGFQPVLLRVLNAALGSFVCGLVYLLLERLSQRPRAAQVGALIVMFWPTFIAWSLTNSKEMAVAACAIGIFYGALSLDERFRPFVALSMIALAGLITFYRIYLVLLILPAVIVYIAIIWIRDGRNPMFAFVASIALLGLATIPFLGVVRYLLGAYSFDRGLAALNTFRFAVAKGGSSLDVQPFNSIDDLLLFLPIGTMNYFLRPFPWDMGGINQTLGAIVMLVYYPLLATAIASIPQLWRTRRAFTAFLLVQTAVLAIAYGVLEGNIGSLMRHRIPTELLILGIGATYLSMRLSQRQTESEPTEDPSPSRDGPAPADHPAVERGASVHPTV